MGVTFGADGTTRQKDQVGGWVIRTRKKSTGEVERANVLTYKVVLKALARYDTDINRLVIMSTVLSSEWHLLSCILP